MLATPDMDDCFAVPRHKVDIDESTWWIREMVRLPSTCDLHVSSIQGLIHPGFELVGKGGGTRSGPASMVVRRGYV